MIDDFLLNLLASLAYDLLKALPSRFQGSRDDLLRELCAELAHLNQALEALNAVLAKLGSERVVRIEGNVSGSVIVIGDGNTVTVADGGALAQRWQELQVGDAEVADLYRERIAQRYAHLAFPLSGLSFHALLEQVYQPLQAAPVKDLTRWYQAEHAPLHERRETNELLTEDRPVALLGLLGGGKTTTLHYLTWAYARRTEDRLLWRGDEYAHWRRKLPTHLVILPDDAFRDFTQYSVEVMTRVALDDESKTVAEGPWTEEHLPVDTLLYAPLAATAPRKSKNATPPEDLPSGKQVLEFVAKHLDQQRIQLGGDETVGRGMVALRFGTAHALNGR